VKMADEHVLAHVDRMCDTQPHTHVRWNSLESQVWEQRSMFKLYVWISIAIPSRARSPTLAANYQVLPKAVLKVLKD